MIHAMLEKLLFVYVAVISLCTDVPPPSEKSRFFSEGGGRSVHRLGSDLICEICSYH